MDKKTKVAFQHFVFFYSMPNKWQSTGRKEGWGGGPFRTGAHVCLEREDQSQSARCGQELNYKEETATEGEKTSSLQRNSVYIGWQVREGPSWAR